MNSCSSVSKISIIDRCCMWWAICELRPLLTSSVWFAFTTVPVHWCCCEIRADMKSFIINWGLSAFQMLLCSISGCYLLCFSFISNLWISILKEGRAEAAQDPRRCLFAPLLLKLLLLHKCNKFLCNSVRVSVRPSRLVFHLFCYSYERWQTEFSWADTCTETIADAPIPHNLAYMTKAKYYIDATDSILLFWCPPRKATLFKSSLCYLYLLIPVDVSQGLYVYVCTLDLYKFKSTCMCLDWL